MGHADAKTTEVYRHDAPDPTGGAALVERAFATRPNLGPNLSETAPTQGDGKPLIDRLDVAVHGVEGDVELVADVALGESAAQEPQDREFALAEFRSGGRARRPPELERTLCRREPSG